MRTALAALASVVTASRCSGPVGTLLLADWSGSAAILVPPAESAGPVVDAVDTMLDSLR